MQKIRSFTQNVIIRTLVVLQRIRFYPEHILPWSLLPLAGSHRGESIPLRRIPFTIGRESGCQIRAKSPHVAPQHCTISEFEGQLVIDDLGTKEGTFLDGQPVVTTTYLGVANVVQVGPLFFKLCWDEELADPFPTIDESAAEVLAENPSFTTGIGEYCR